MLKFHLQSERRIFYRGELICFVLESDAPVSGHAALRTNIGMAAVRRREIIAETETGMRPAGRDWRDLPMRTVDERRFELAIPLLDVGIFEAKAFLAPGDGAQLSWPEGENIRIKVEPAENIGANIMYTAFVRQFDGNAALAARPRDNDATLDRFARDGYAAIPPSGTFRNLKSKLDFLFDELGVRILQLLPIHPTPTVYGRMGRYGSPFAALDYFAVDPALAEFDPKATPLAQFIELADAVHAKNGRIFLDIPVNHTGWGSRLQLEHPEWFVHTAEGAIASPGAWGVVWADLCKLDYTQDAVHRYMAEVFLYWCRLGVDGFRCDAGYMLPEAAWRYIEAKVRHEFPATVFMLEGLGGPMDKQEQLLGRCGLDWAYSELFQNYTRPEIERCFSDIKRSNRYFGTLIHFAETHDNNRLAANSPTFAAMRCVLSAFLSQAGAYGFTNGVEWYATEKIDVHEASALNWGNAHNMVPLLRRLHAILRVHPAFYGDAQVDLYDSGNPAVVGVRRTAKDGETLTGYINLDCLHAQSIRSDAGRVELMSGKTLPSGALELAPGGAVLLGDREKRLEEIATELSAPFQIPEALRRQRLQALALDLWLCKATRHPGTVPDVEKLAERFRCDWTGLFREVVSSNIAPVVHFHDGVDQRRMVMLPMGCFLAIHSRYSFYAKLKNGDFTLREAVSVRLDDGEFLVLLRPLSTLEHSGERALTLELELVAAEPVGAVRRIGRVRCLPPGDTARMRLSFNPFELKSGPPRHALSVTEYGGMTQVPAAWGTLVSKYDALLAGNLNRHYPVDRRVMFSRCKAWVVLDDFSQELKLDLLDRFTVNQHNAARWEFAIPVGKGQFIRLDLTVCTARNTDAVTLNFTRRPARKGSTMLPDTDAVKLILRPALDDRINHETTKAFTGPERSFPAAVQARADGLSFTPAPERKLTLQMPGSHFHRADEWQYMLELPLESYYGLEHHTDLYSPGYFEFQLTGGATGTLTAIITADSHAVTPEFPTAATALLPPEVPIDAGIAAALNAFVVRRDDSQTVIAGYPWFLDWGRDTLIVLRGLIAAERYSEVESIIRAFAGFERNGTIPNMIRGRNDSNRDTSDAPLWLVVAVSDAVQSAMGEKLLTLRCGERTLLEVLTAIADNYIQGTPNGIRVDPASGLVFSPAHFTWMDTNFPAATPREGYPIEIQALWFATLNFLSRFAPRFQALRDQVQASIRRYFYLPDARRLSDCLHARPGVPAEQAVPDNAIRPNMLFAVTLGAIADLELARQIVRACDCLLIPGAIRSLADAPVTPPLPVVRDGVLLNNPDHPYIGHYCGAEDTRRKVSYHNGTAWCWPFPSYVEALVLAGGDRGIAMSLLSSGVEYFDHGCPGQLPEIADGDYPHHWGGCAAQAWSVSEFYRIWKMLTRE